MENKLDLSNKETFLRNVAQWIPTDNTLPKPTVYVYDSQDDSECKNNFKKTE